MCEVLLRVVDKVNAVDPYKDAKCLKRGDFVVVQGDGWSWGTKELSNPDWRIVKMPSVTVSDATAFMGPEMDSNPATPSLVLRRRGYMLNVDDPALPLDFRNWIADASRAAPTMILNYTPAQLMAVRVKKTAMSNPNAMA